MKHVTLILILLLLAGCGTKQKIPQATTTKLKDLRTEVRIQRITTIDTLLYFLPQSKQERTTKADSSTLENQYAKSTALIDPEGNLHHTLEMKKDPIPVPVEKTTERRDSTMYKNEDTTKLEPVYIEKDLTWWQQAQIYGFKILVAFTALYIAFRKRKYILTLIYRLIKP